MNYLRHRSTGFFDLRVDLTEATTGSGSSVMPPFVNNASPKGNRIRQILSAINCRFLGPNSR